MVELPLFTAAVVDVVQLFIDCDPVGQAICVLLAIFSIIAWAVMFGKYRELKELRRLNHIFEVRLRAEKSVIDQPESARQQRSIPYADLFADAVEAYWRAAAIGQ